MAIATFLGVVSWQTHTPAQTSPQAPLTLEAANLTLQELAPGVFGLIADTDFPPADPNIAICNGGIVVGSDGVLVIDPFHNAALGNLMLATVSSLTDQPVRYVLNTHYHFDHTGGNPAAQEQDIPIVGRGPIREFIVTRNQEQDPNPTPPDLIVNNTSDLWLGDRHVVVETAEGHSGGTDVVAYVPDANVLFAGDILFYQRFPYTGDGDIRQWQESLGYLIDTYPTATVLPGHGPVTDQQGLVELKGYFDNLEQLAFSWKEQSLSQEEAIASAAEPPASYSGYRFQGLYPGNLETAYQQFVVADEESP